MEGLPFVDAHARDIPAEPRDVWDALLHVFASAIARPSGHAYARWVRAQPQRSEGNPPDTGATFPGFRIVGSRAPHELRLEGRHRFARYALDLRCEPRGTGTRLTATTHAAFPGLAGRAYRLAVIGSGAHAVVMRRLLARVASRALAAGPRQAVT